MEVRQDLVDETEVVLRSLSGMKNEPLAVGPAGFGALPGVGEGFPDRSAQTLQVRDSAGMAANVDPVVVLRVSPGEAEHLRKGLREEPGAVDVDDRSSVQEAVLQGHSAHVGDQKIRFPKPGVGIGRAVHVEAGVGGEAFFQPSRPRDTDSLYPPRVRVHGVEPDPEVHILFKKDADDLFSVKVQGGAGFVGGGVEDRRALALRPSLRRWGEERVTLRVTGPVGPGLRSLRGREFLEGFLKQLFQEGACQKEVVEEEGLGDDGVPLTGETVGDQERSTGTGRDAPGVLGEGDEEVEGGVPGGGNIGECSAAGEVRNRLDGGEEGEADLPPLVQGRENLFDVCGLGWELNLPENPPLPEEAVQEETKVKGEERGEKGEPSPQAFKAFHRSGTGAEWGMGGERGDEWLSGGDPGGGSGWRGEVRGGAEGGEGGGASEGGRPWRRGYGSSGTSRSGSPAPQRGFETLGGIGRSRGSPLGRETALPG